MHLLPVDPLEGRMQWCFSMIPRTVMIGTVYSITFDTWEAGNRAIPSNLTLLHDSSFGADDAMSEL